MQILRAYLFKNRGAPFAKCAISVEIRQFFM